jgi:hypothetical protein
MTNSKRTGFVVAVPWRGPPLGDPQHDTMTGLTLNGTNAWFPAFAIPIAIAF